MLRINPGYGYYFSFSLTIRKVVIDKPSTVNRELACLSHLFNFAKRENGFFGSNPVSVSKLLPENNQIDRILTPEEEFRLISACSGHLRPIIIPALNTGTRKGEIITA